MNFKCNLTMLASVTILMCGIFARAYSEPINGLKEAQAAVSQITGNSSIVKPEIKSVGDMRVTPVSFKFTGDMIASDSELQEMAVPYIGKEVSVGDLKQLCQAISQFLRSRGFAVAQAYLPEQKISGGQIEIGIIGGRYGEINIVKNTKISGAAIKKELGGVKSGEYIRTASLERASLLLNDLGGIKAKAALSAGSAMGTSDLTLTVDSAAKPFSLETTFDDYGSYSIGKNQTGFNINCDNPMHKGDNLSLRVSTANTNGQWLWMMGYKMPVGMDGGKLDIGYSRNTYSLGKEFSVLDATGISGASNIAWTKDLLRSQSDNMSISIGLDNVALTSTQPLLSQKQVLNRINLSLNGNKTANGMAGSWAATITDGNAKMKSADAVNMDTFLNAAGNYFKLSGNLMTQQKISSRLNILGKINGQSASKNLVSYENLSLGGPNGVRAYGVGEASGNSGMDGTVEFRWLAPTGNRYKGSLQLTSFYDLGKVKINQKSYPGQNDSNDTILSGAGLGFILDQPKSYSLNISYAWRTRSQLSTTGGSPDKNGRLWIMASKKL